MKQKYKLEATENATQTINNQTSASLGLGAVELKDLPPILKSPWNQKWTIPVAVENPQPPKIIFSAFIKLG